MKQENSDELLIYRNKMSGIRLGGILFLLVGLCLIFGAWFMTAYFGGAELLSKIITGLIIIIFGVSLFICGCVMMMQKDSEMTFDAKNAVLYFSEKNFFSHKKTQHSFSEIINFGQTAAATENQNYYTNYLHLSNSTGLEIPPINESKKELQDQQIEEIKKFISFKNDSI